MTVENYILAALAGFVTGWIANALSRNQFGFSVNLFVGVFGAILPNLFLHDAEMISTRFLPVLGVSLAGSSVLLILFHISRLTERVRRKDRL
ncbi:MAG TPA: transglycosylase [Asticcacaulis sp.]|nr:transglycosylase [Asticcacaulis sp.]